MSTPTSTAAIVADANADLDGVRSVRQAVRDAGMVPLVIAPVGGRLDAEGDPVTVQRTFATARSIEFDVLLLAGAPGPGGDAAGARDTKADNTGTASAVTTDPRAQLLVNEAFRHGKAIGAWAGGESILARSGVPVDAPGVVSEENGIAVLEKIATLLGAHRVWARFTSQA